MSAKFTRFACPNDDGSDAHVEVRVRMPLRLNDAVRVFETLAPLRCGCGAELVVPKPRPRSTKGRGK